MSEHSTTPVSEQGRQPGRWWDTQGKDGTSIPATAACAALTLKVFARAPTSGPSSQAPNFNMHTDDDKSRQA